jgi:hypothetical protein
MKKKLMIIGLIVQTEVMLANAGPYVTNVIARQRYPWNGKVDITYDVVGNISEDLSEWRKPVLMVSATGFKYKDVKANIYDGASTSNLTDNVTTSGLVSCESWIAMKLSGDPSAKEGRHHVIWDMREEGLLVDYSNVVFNVKLGTPEYCVIDISAGANATSYPVAYFVCLFGKSLGKLTTYHKAYYPVDCKRLASFRGNMLAIAHNRYLIGYS